MITGLVWSRGAIGPVQVPPSCACPTVLWITPQGTLVENDMEWDMDLRHIWDLTTALAPSSRYDMDLPEWTALVPPSQKREFLICFNFVWDRAMDTGGGTIGGCHC